MHIIITCGTGEGPTPLAAFDQALLNAGVANYNLIYLSSIIPAASTIERAKFVTPPEEYGHRLYVVMARHDEHVAGNVAWAGIGWTQEVETGRGLFVELHGNDRTEVEKAIQDSLTCMVSSRPLNYGPIQYELASKTCTGTPVCAAVLAVYKSEAWND